MESQPRKSVMKYSKIQIEFRSTRRAIMSATIYDTVISPHYRIYVHSSTIVLLFLCHGISNFRINTVQID